MWYLFVIVSSMQLCEVSFAQYAKNVAAKMISGLGSRTPLGVPFQIRGRFENTGSQELTDVQVAAFVRNPQGVVVYRDTETVALWASGEAEEIPFRDYTPTQKGIYGICILSLLPGDENGSDDTICDSVRVVYERGLAAVAVVFPPPDTVMPAYQSFQPIGSVVERGGLNDYFDVRARVQIKRCGDSKLVFQADTTIPEVFLDAPPSKFFLPASSTTFDTKDLPPGCYIIATILLLSDDVDRTDDTASAIFTLSELGVGRQDNDLFQLLPAYPNPASEITTLRYHLPDDGKVTIRLLDPAGRIVQHIASNEYRIRGDHVVTIPIHDLSAGIYRCELTLTISDGTNHRSSKTIVVVK